MTDAVAAPARPVSRWQGYLGKKLERARRPLLEAAGAGLAAEVDDRVDEVAQTLLPAERFAGEAPPTDSQRRQLKRFVRRLFSRLDDEQLARAAALRGIPFDDRSLTLRRLVRWSLRPQPHARRWMRATLAEAAAAPSVVALDLETTGLDSRYQVIIEIAALRFNHDGREVGRYVTLVNPGRPLSPFIRRVTGLDEATLEREGHSPAEALRALLAFLQAPRPTSCDSSLILHDPPIVGHNVGFDLDFLERAWLREGLTPPRLRAVCTDVEARRLLPEAPSHALSALCDYLGIAHDPAHRGESDARAAYALYGSLLAAEAGPLSPSATRASTSATSNGLRR